MKREKTILAIILLAVMTGCGGVNKQTTDDFIIVDVSKSYPKKELILQDFMDVEYILLETNDEFLNQGFVRAIGKNHIIVMNQIRDGAIFVYDRSGKAIRKINRMGQGGEEYTSISGIILDEENNEMFVSDPTKILIYDLYGKYVRSIKPKDGSRYNARYSFNKENLICYDRSFDYDEEMTERTPFVIISKKDGSITNEIQIIVQQKRPPQTRIERNGIIIVGYVSNFTGTSIVPCQNSWILTNYSNDTVFRYLPNHQLIPFMVRTPSIQSGRTPEAYLSLGILTELYYFLRTEKAEPEVRGSTAEMIFPTTDLLFDRQEKAIYEYSVYNDDYIKKITVNMSRTAINDEIAFWQKIEAYALIDAYKNGELKDGKLKEIAAKLDAEDNPVIMLVKHKK